MGHLEDQARLLDGTRQRQLDEERFEAVLSLGRRKDRLQQLRLAKSAVAGAGPTNGLLPTVAALTDHEVRNFSLGRLCKNLAESSGGVDGSKPMESCLELEVSASISNDLKSVPPHGGIWLPLTLRPTQSGLDSKTGSAGQYTEATKLSQISDALRAHTMVLKAGATFLSGLNNYRLPIEDSIMAGSWTSENSGVDSPQSDPSFKAGTAKPHELIATTVVSRQLLAQANESISAWLTSRIAKSNALALDLAALHGTGANGQPSGIAGWANIGVVALGSNGAAPTLASVLALEGAVAGANADSPSCSFLTNSIMRTKLRGIAEITSGTTPLWRDGSMLGYPAYCSNQVSSTLTKGNNSDCSAIFFAAWEHLILAEFKGAVELLADPYTRAKQGVTLFTSYGAFDIVLLQPGAVAAILDARNV